MCGIAGKLHFRTTTTASCDANLLERMAGHMEHRGPDAFGIWHDPAGGLSLAHRRLSIIDCDSRAHQPMLNEDASIALSFNGEIYNFMDLRRDLLASGRHSLRTSGDAEVILHLYEESPDDIPRFLNKLRGMFAFGLWDRRKGELLLARDPVGKKPLYYAETNGAFVFASSIAALLENDELRRQPNLEAIQAYLVLGYIPAPFSAFLGISKLPAATYLVADTNGIRKIARYWSLNFEPKLNLPEPELAQLLMQELEAATRLRMISDVPLGAFLSGGIDSSAVVAVMSQLSSRPVRTFSVSFQGTTLDESRYALLVASHFGCDHTELTIDVKPEVLPELVQAFEEPFADAAAIPTYYMARVARQHVTVILNGDGGDEDFAGYALRHLSYRWAERLRLPSPSSALILALASRLPTFLSESSLPYRLKKTLRILGERDWRRNLALMELLSPTDMGANWVAGQQNPPDEDFLAPVKAVWQDAQRLRGLDRELLFSFALHLPEELLVKVDRASMAWSLEARSPLLDRSFIQVCAAIDDGLKLKGRSTKHIFKLALQGTVPQEILARPKQGFNTPLDGWLRKELRQLVEYGLLGDDSFVGTLLDRKVVHRLVREHLSGRMDHQRSLYSLLNLELWERQFVRRQRI